MRIIETKPIFFVALFLSATVLISFSIDQDFPPLPRLKSVTEWREWVDKEKYHESKKWLKSKREYYRNGAIASCLYVEANGDTTSLRVYKLNKDSTIKTDIWYNRFLKKWMNGDKYYYKKGIKLPYMTKDNNDYTCHFVYDASGHLTGKLLKDDNNESFTEYEYRYDSAGLMVGQTEFGFFGGQRDEKRQYVYEYKKDNKGRVIERETFFVPHAEQESVVKTDKKGNQQITYYGFTAKEKSIIETIYFNEKGERVRKIEYDREGEPQFIWTYEYEYYTR